MASDKPRFGEWVRFTQYAEKRTYEEYKALMEAEVGTITLKMMPNPKPDEPAMVIGVVTKSGEMHLTDVHDFGEGRRYATIYGRNRCFYVLRRSIRGKRYYVAPEDIQKGGDAS